MSQKFENDQYIMILTARISQTVCFQADGLDSSILVRIEISIYVAFTKFEYKNIQSGLEFVLRDYTLLRLNTPKHPIISFILKQMERLFNSCFTFSCLFLLQL